MTADTAAAAADLWTRLVEAGRLEDASVAVTTVAQLLACRPSVRSLRLDEPLWRLDCSDLDACLERHLRDDCTDDQSMDGATYKSESVHWAIQALLQIPTAYETPWKAACWYMARVQQETGALDASPLWLRSSIVRVQCFVQQAVAAWWDEERRTTASRQRKVRRSMPRPVAEVPTEQTPRYWILRLVSIILQPLRCTTPVSHVTVPAPAHSTSTVGGTEQCVTLELVSTIVSLMHGLDTPLTHHALDLVFSCERIQPHSLVPWVHLASELRLLLREEDWIAVYTNLHDTLQSLPCGSLDPWTRTEWITLTETILSLSVEGGCTNKVQSHLWPGVVVQIMQAAAACSTATTCTELEEALEANVSLLQFSRFQSLVDSLVSNPTACTFTIDSRLVSDDRFTKQWIEANLLLVCLRVSKKTRSRLIPQIIDSILYGTSRPRNKTVNQGDDTSDVSLVIWKRLQGLIVESLPKEARATVATTATKHRSRAMAIRHVFDGMRYSSPGRFTLKRRSGSHCGEYVSGVSLLVWYSMAAGATRDAWIPHATKRATTWARCAYEALSRFEAGDIEQVVTAMVIWVTVFMEIPTLRSELSQQMLEAHSSSNACHAAHVDHWHSTIISVVLSSVDLERSGSLNDCTRDLDEFSPMLFQSVDLSLFCELARVLSPLASARRILLSLAKSHLNNGFLHLQDSSIKVPSVTDSDTKLKCGLFAAITLLGMEIWDEHNVEACCFLSEIIVDNRPHIPFSARRWMFQALAKEALERRLSSRAAAHMQMVCLSRLLFFVGADRQEGDSSFLYEMAFVRWEDDAPNQIEDVFGLFQLAMTLLQYNPVDDIASNENVHQCRQRFLDRLATTGHPEVEAELREDSFISLEGGCDPCCLLTFYFLQELRAIPSVFNHMTPPTRGELIKILLAAMVDDPGQTPESKWMSTWLKQWARDPCEKNAQRHFNRTQRALIGVDCCDTVIDLLLGTIRSMCSAYDESFGSSEKYMSLSTLVLVNYGKRRRFVEILQETGCMRTLDQVTCERMVGRLAGFCVMIVPLLSKALEESNDATQIDDILLSVADLCDAVSLLLEQSSHEAERPLKLSLEDLWRLHLWFSDETSAKRLVAAFERLCSAGSTRICLFPVHKLNDIDAPVRWLRKPVLRALYAGFASYRQRVQSGSLPDDEIVDLSFLATAVEHLLADLVSGLEGASGGLDYGLTSSFVDSITSISMTLMHMLETSNSDEAAERSNLALFCTSASDTLDEILCSFALPTDIFKKALLLHVVWFPSIARRARLHALSTGVKRSTPPIVKLLQQLCNILKRKAAIAHQPTTAWITIAGPDHTGVRDDYSDDVSVLSDGHVDGGEMRIVSPFETGDDRSLTKATLLLPSEHSWTQSFCIAFMAVEEVWDGPLCVAVHKSDRVGCVSEHASLELSRHYGIRQEELVDTLKSMENLFGSVTCESEVLGASVRCHSALVLSLAPMAKTKCFSAVSRIVAALQQSVKSVLSQFSSESMSQCFDFVEPSLADAISCLVSWLSYRSENADIVSGLTRWAMAEPERSSNPRRCIASSEASTHVRFLKLLRGVDQLENGLEDLLTVAKDCKRQFGRSNPHAFLAKMDSLIQQTETDKPESTFYNVLSEKLSLLFRQRAQIDHEFGVPTTRERDPESAKKLLRRVRQESRKRAVRSRNKVIDKLLQLDRQTHMKEWDNDLFADLEDFIADG